MLNSLISELQDHASSEKAQIYQRFFKTEKGQYGEGDIFLGLTVPEQRILAQKYIFLGLSKLQQLIKSKIHEHRLTALLILTYKYKKSKEKDKEEIFNFYLKNLKHVNNWDLVDLTASTIVGGFLLDKDKKPIYHLVQSKDLWEKRISIVSTYTFIKNNQFEDTLAISELLLKDKHDLIHKAVGWMLREVGKKDKNVLDKFLKQYYKDIPRTALRYAIEKHPEDERKKWLKGELK